MLGLTTLGVVHTLIALVALFCGFYALAMHKEISLKTRTGLVYVVLTFIAAATSLGIFQHGGFGPPHVVAILTIVALIVGTVASTTRLYGRASRYVQIIAYSATILFHLIPALVETLTRLPPGAPWVKSQDAPIFQVIFAVLLVLYLILVTLQIRWMRAAPAPFVDDEELGKTTT
jgi:uncharacterized membrane protein